MDQELLFIFTKTQASISSNEADVIPSYKNKVPNLIKISVPEELHDQRTARSFSNSSIPEFSNRLDQIMFHFIY
jgi:hypothetical protein